jgi:hypothetical protein
MTSEPRACTGTLQYIEHQPEIFTTALIFFDYPTPLIKPWAILRQPHKYRRLKGEGVPSDSVAPIFQSYPSRSCIPKTSPVHQVCSQATPARAAKRADGINTIAEQMQRPLKRLLPVVGPKPDPPAPKRSRRSIVACEPCRTKKIKASFNKSPFYR